MKKLMIILAASLLLACAADDDENDQTTVCEDDDDNNNAGEWTPVQFKQVNNYDWRVDLERKGVVFDWWHEDILVRNYSEFYELTHDLFSFMDTFPFVVTNPEYDWDTVPPGSLIEAENQAFVQSCLKMTERSECAGHMQGRHLVNLNPSWETPLLYPIPTSNSSRLYSCGYRTASFQGYSVIYDFCASPYFINDGYEDELEKIERECTPVFNKLRGSGEGRFMLMISIFAELDIWDDDPFLSVESVEENGEFLKVKVFPMLGSPPNDILRYYTKINYSDAYISLPDKYRGYQFGFELLTDSEACPAVEAE